MKTVILTAGQGKRMMPLTQYISKSMLPIGEKPAFTMIVEESVVAGAEEICIVIFPDSPLPAFCEFYREYSPAFARANIHFVLQEKPLGSGDALLQAESFCKKERFFLANCDELFEKNAFQQLAESGGLCIGAKKVTKKEGKKYGVIHSTAERIIAIEEKPQELDSTPVVSVGRYLLDGRVFDSIKQTSFVGGERRLTDSLNILFAKTTVFPKIIKGRRFDTGNFNGYCKAFCYFAKNIIDK